MTDTTKKLTRAHARKVLEVVDAGLSHGLGKPEPGQMCVEAAVCFALGLPHSDDPLCVSPALRRLKIMLNDMNWSSNKARAKGMRRLAIAQLGTLDVLDDVAFTGHVAEMLIRKLLPRTLRIAAKINTNAEHKAKLEECAVRCEKDGDANAAKYAAEYAAKYAANAAEYAAEYAAENAAEYAAKYAANAAKYAAKYAAEYAANAAEYAAEYAANAYDKELAFICEEIVQILIGMKVPAVKWLDLTE